MDNVIWIHKTFNLNSLTPKLFNILFFHIALILKFKLFWIFIVKIQKNEVKVNRFTLILRIINCYVHILIEICVLRKYIYGIPFILFSF